MRGTGAPVAPPQHGRLSGSICFAERFMWSSALDAKLEFLADQVRAVPLRAWSARVFSAVSSTAASLDALYNSFSWEREPFHAALRDLQQHNADALAAVMVLVEETAGACRARMRHTFAVCVGRVRQPRDTTQEHRVLNAVAAAIEELKEAAFASTFIYPAIQLFRCVGNATMEADVDVHGVNVYASLLQTFLHVKIARAPLLEDEVKGVVDFVSVAAFQPVLQRLWCPDNCGRHVGGLPPVRLRDAGYGFSFVFPHNGVVSDLLSRALDSANESLRCRFDVYLQQFCSYFRPEFALQRLFQKLSADDDTLADLQAHARAVHLVPPDVDLRAYLWGSGEGDDSFAFNIARATSLFEGLGVVREGAASRGVPPPALGGAIGLSATGGDHATERDVPPNRRVPSDAIRLSAAGDIAGGGTGREFVANLLNDGNEGWNKWVHPGHVVQSFVKAEFTAPHLITGVSLCSANDCPHRDPLRVRFVASVPNGRASVTLASVTLSFSARWQYHYVLFERPVVAHALVMHIDEVLRPGDGLQIGHWHIEGHRVNVEPANATLAASPAPLSLQHRPGLQRRVAEHQAEQRRADVLPPPPPPPTVETGGAAQPLYPHGRRDLLFLLAFVAMLVVVSVSRAPPV